MHKLQDPYYYRNISSSRLYCIVVLRSGHGWLIHTCSALAVFQRPRGSGLCSLKILDAKRRIFV